MLAKTGVTAWEGIMFGGGGYESERQLRKMHCAASIHPSIPHLSDVALRRSGAYPKSTRQGITQDVAPTHHRAHTPFTPNAALRPSCRNL